MYILLRFYSPTWFPLSNPFPPATSPYLQFDLFDVHGSIYPIRLAPSRGDTRLRDLRGAVPHLSGSEVLFVARPTSPLQRERHSPEFILSSFWVHSEFVLSSLIQRRLPWAEWFQTRWSHELVCLTSGLRSHIHRETVASCRTPQWYSKMDQSHRLHPFLSRWHSCHCIGTNHWDTVGS